MQKIRNSHPAIEYIKNLYAPEDALLKEINKALKDYNRSWQIGSDEGKLLQLLIRMNKVKTIVEVGTLLGYSTIWMARALPEDGHIYALEKSPEHAKLARDFFARSTIGSKISLVEGDAIKTLQTLSSQGPFDMIFIDADKPGYNAYLDWAEKNIKTGGLIVADNTLLFGSVYKDSPGDDVAPSTWAALRRFNERLADQNLYHSLLFPTEEGMTIAIKI